MERGLTKNDILSALMKSPHGALAEYLPVGQKASVQEPEFLAHLIAYDREKGQIRDSKVALPVISLQNPTLHEEFRENAMAHLALLVPRELLRAIRFAMEIKVPQTGLRKLVKAYLRHKEENWAAWERAAVQHRATLKELYSLWHVKPSAMADAVLFKGQRPRGSVFEAIANLKNMTAAEAAGTIMERRIPFLIAMGALGAKMKEPDLVLALIERMSPAELMNNSKMLEKLGVKTVPALRAAYEQALVRAAGSKKVSSFKATVAAEAVEDETLKAKLQAVQEKQIKQISINGNWLVLGDKSGSMSHAIELSKLVASTLAKAVSGQVHLVFFDTVPKYMDVSGKTYDQILKLTKHVAAGGGTSIGCGLLAIAERKIEVDGIAVVSDGGENNTPMFAHTYKAYSQAIGKEVPVYFYKTTGDSDAFSRSLRAAEIDVQIFDLTSGKTDHYALAGLVSSMRTQRYSLVDAIMEFPLLTVNQVLGKAWEPKHQAVTV
jgi:hypothetical protein